MRLRYVTDERRTCISFCAMPEPAELELHKRVNRGSSEPQVAAGGNGTS